MQELVIGLTAESVDSRTRHGSLNTDNLVTVDRIVTSCALLRLLFVTLRIDRRVHAAERLHVKHRNCK